MKKLVMTLAALGASVSVAHAGQYLQASSSVTQCPGKAPKLVEMDIVDAANGITLANNKVTVGEAGPYLIVAAPQVGREGGGPYGCFRPVAAGQRHGCRQLQRAALPGRRQHGEGCPSFRRVSFPWRWATCWK